MTKPYDYTPDFTPSEEPCEAPTYVENRARLWDGGTYFRSRECGTDKNNIALELAAVSGVGYNFVLSVFVNGEFKERFTTFRGPLIVPVAPPPSESDPNPVAPDPYYDPSGIEELRGKVNSLSVIIEMRTRGTDVFDEGGVDDSGIQPFSRRNLMGGDGGPSDGSDLAQIRTGPERSLIIIQTTEDENGNPITPDANKRVQQWDGSKWITYIPNE